MGPSHGPNLRWRTLNRAAIRFVGYGACKAAKVELDAFAGASPGTDR